MKIILIFGDSITYGAWDKEGGWVARLRKFINKKSSEYLIYNLGISGDTAENLLKRFESETEQRVEGEEDIFIFAIGLNDSQFIHSKKNTRFSLQEFKNNIQKIISLAKKSSPKIIFLGLTPVDEKKTVPWSEDKSYKNEYIQKFNEIIKTICNENNAYFIEIFERLIKINYKKLLDDGAHPNSKGHEKIFKSVKDSLIKNKIIR